MRGTIRDDAGMPMPTTTALYGALKAVFTIALAARVTAYRVREKVSLGTGKSDPLLVAVRTHGNAAEHVPLAIVMMLVVELCGAASTWLHVAGGAIFVARIAHAIGMPRPAPNPFRFLGTAITWTTIVLLSGWALWLRRGE